MMLVWPLIYIKRGGSCSLILIIISSQSKGNSFFIPPCKPPDTVMYRNEVQTTDLKKGWVY